MTRLSQPSGTTLSQPCHNLVTTLLFLYGISGLRESDGWRHRATKEQPQPSELDPLQLRHSDQEEEEDDSSQNGATSITSGHGDSNDGVRGGKERKRGVEERHRESLPLLLWVSLLKESVEPRGMA